MYRGHLRAVTLNRDVEAKQKGTRQKFPQNGQEEKDPLSDKACGLRDSRLKALGRQVKDFGLAE